MTNNKRPSPEIEAAVFGYVDPDEPVPDSWKAQVLTTLADYEAKHGGVPMLIMALLRDVVSRIEKAHLDMLGLVLDTDAD